MTSAMQSRRGMPRWAWFVIVPVGILLILFVVVAAMPLQQDPTIPQEEWGVGADNIEPSNTGLLREWPEPNGEFNPEMAALGYQLFFDPVLSDNNERSCASCHHPDWGFSDSTPRAMAPDGETEGQRHAPTLWNVAYGEAFFWDGRAATLEEQAKVSMFSEMELDSDPELVVAELQEIPEYQEQFDALFDDGITEDTVAQALAAFERTLISDGAAFDDYANGDFDALTTQQRRGLGVFRSAGTRCFECHSAPLFTDNTFAVVPVDSGGVEDRGAADAGGVEFAFKVPTLRNVVLRGPYMHNGSEETLESVIDLYGHGGEDFEIAEVDRRVSGFTLSDQEVSDLVAFFHALTDETIPEEYWSAGYVDDEGRVQIPESVPSGMDVVAAIDNPAREMGEQISAAPHERPSCEITEDHTIIVRAGGSIQAAVDCAEPGDTIVVEPGVYNERVVIDVNDITLKGMADEPDACPVRGDDDRFPTGDAAPEWPILEGDVDGDGKPDLTDGVIASGSNFRMEYFIVQNYRGNGVLVEGVTGVTLRHLFTSDTGLYGVYPVHSNDVLVECMVAEKIHDAAVYVGQSQEIVVRWNLAYDSVTGIEIENSHNAVVYENESWGNVGGILIFLLPNISSRISQNIEVYDNYVHDNNREKGDARPGSVVSLVPLGTGIFVMATDNVDIHDNKIENNNSFGVAIASLYQAYKPEDIGNEVGALPENIWIHDNEFINNGTDVDPSVKEAGLPGADVLWDTSGTGVTVDEDEASMFPPALPSENAPGFWQRFLWNLWGLAGKL